MFKFSIKAAELTQSEGRLAQLELIVPMATVVGAVSRWGRGLPHQKVVIDPFQRSDRGSKINNYFGCKIKDA